MANNCLVTKLQSSINNDNLSKLGLMKVICKTTNPSQEYSIGSGSSSTIFRHYNSEGTLIATYTERMQNVIVHNNDYIIIDNKYPITDFWLYSAYFDFEDIAYTNITYLQMPNYLKSANIEALSTLRDVTAIWIQLSFNIYGNIEKLGDALNVTDDIPVDSYMLHLGDTKITGNMNRLFDRLYERGKTFGSISYVPSRYTINTYTEPTVADLYRVRFTENGWEPILPE